MAIQKAAYELLKAELDTRQVTLVAVSKTKPIADIQALYDLGHRDFGENYVQEMVAKHAVLPGDIRWHFIGHLQSNKVKQIASFVHLVHGVESWKLLQEISKQGAKYHRDISLLMQMHIAAEETKFGMNEQEAEEMVASLADHPLRHIRIRGMMGMASFTQDAVKLKQEFSFLKALYDRFSQLKTSNIQFDTLSMGMSGDYKLALETGSNMVRIGSLIFGNR